MADQVTTGAKALKVLIADDQTAARAGMRRALEPHEIRVIAETTNAAEALQMVFERRPDLCIVAAGLPGNGIEAVRLIKQSVPATKVVVLTSAARDEELFAALRAGADGYLPMTTPASSLPRVVRGVVNGEAALSRSLTARLILEFRERGTKRRLNLGSTDVEVELTAREFEVLEGLRKRERTAEIAGQLGISEVTVRRHVSSILQKVGSPNRQTAVQMLEQADLQTL